jgi:hypothetical protein
MPKRKRNSEVELIAVDDSGIIIEWNRKEYYVCGGNNYIDLLDHQDVECEIIHNSEHRAMLNIENLRSGEIVLRQEINPFKFKDSGEWVKDE